MDALDRGGARIDSPRPQTQNARHTIEGFHVTKLSRMEAFPFAKLARACRLMFVSHVARIALSAAMLASLSSAATALDSTPASSPPEPAASATPDPTLSAYASQNPNCREWSDACAVCTRDEAGRPRCSLPGIACLPKPIVCSKEAT